MQLNQLIKLLFTKKRGLPLLFAIIGVLLTISSQNKSLTESLRKSFCHLFKFAISDCNIADVNSDESEENNATALTGKSTGRVVHVDDGDTLVLLTKDGAKKKIRLSDIDAPETGKGSNRPGQRHAEAAKDYLTKLVNEKTVEAECFGSGGYGRSACMIYIDDKNINHELVRVGLAWANRQNPRYVRDKNVFELEDTAKQARLGIWSTDSAVAPWIWRKRCWKEKQCD